MIPMSERERRNAEISYRSAMAGMVLLENNGALPIARGGKIALYGIGAVRTVRGGTGSGDLKQCACHILSVLLKISGGDRDRKRETVLK